MDDGRVVVPSRDQEIDRIGGRRRGVSSHVYILGNNGIEAFGRSVLRFARGAREPG
jgi:hypothetical protein